MELIDLIASFETKMLKDLEQYANDKLQLGTSIESIGIIMAILKSQQELKEQIKRGQFNASHEDIEEAMKSAYLKVYSQAFKSLDSTPPDFKSLFVGTIRLYNKDIDDSTLDIFEIKPIAGKTTSALLIHREEAEEVGFELDKSYLISCEAHHHSNDLTCRYFFEPKKEMTAIEIISAVDKLGQAMIIDV